MRNFSALRKCVCIPISKGFALYFLCFDDAVTIPGCLEYAKPANGRARLTPCQYAGNRQRTLLGLVLRVVLFEHTESLWKSYFGRLVNRQAVERFRLPP